MDNFHIKERVREVVHRNEKLSEYYKTLNSDTDRLIAIQTVRFIMDNFPTTKRELLGRKIVDHYIEEETWG